MQIAVLGLKHHAKTEFFRRNDEGCSQGLGQYPGGTLAMPAQVLQPVAVDVLPSLKKGDS